MRRWSLGGRPIRRLGPGAALSLLALALVASPTPPARAGTLDIVVQSTTALPGSTGQFDIDLVNNTSSAVSIGGFSVDVAISDPNIQLTAIDNGTTAPYIFSITGSFDTGFAGQNSSSEVAGNDLAASGGQLVNPGQTWGLAHVTYLVDPAAPLGTVVNVTFPSVSGLPPPNGTSLADANGNPVDFAMVNGTITIARIAVPEPASVTLLGVAGAAVVAGMRVARRRRAA